MNLSYVVALVAGAVVAMSGRYLIVSGENMEIRNKLFLQQQATDALQVELLNKREQIRLQQEKLNKGSAISESIGPAVVADIQSLAEKSKNPKLQELLQKHSPRDSSVRFENPTVIDPAKKGER